MIDRCGLDGEQAQQLHVDQTVFDRRVVNLDGIDDRFLTRDVIDRGVMSRTDLIPVAGIELMNFLLRGNRRTHIRRLQPLTRPFSHLVTTREVDRDAAGLFFHSLYHDAFNRNFRRGCQFPRQG